jgi:uncharacterized protein (TIGR02246 family)
VVRLTARRRRLLLAACAIALAAGCGDGTTATRDTARQALEARERDFTAALAARDADRMAALFAEDAVLHVANMPPVEGRDSVAQFYGNTFRFLSDSRSTPETLHVSDGGDMAYTTGSVTNEFHRPDGPVEYAGKHVLICRAVDGEWMIALYAISSNQPAGTP